MIGELIIIGAGGSSREIAGAAEEVNHLSPRWNLIGFLDDDPAKQGTEVDGLPVLGPIDSAARYAAQFIIGIAHWRKPGARRQIVERIGLPRERYATLIHPSASISSRARIGAGTAVLHNVVITAGTVVGDHVLIEQNVTLSHDQTVEDFVTIGPAATIAGNVRLRQGSYIGAGCTILSGVTVNEGALAGIGAIVMNDVPAHRTVSGSPAQLLPQLWSKDVR
jgi:sugar O-acyltransferase (sialic acid O-acetyltransferase NeuD family)